MIGFKTKMDELVEVKKDIMIKYLKVAYPIKRLRDGRRYKRGFVINDVPYFLKSRSELNKAFNALKEMLIIVFDASEYEANLTVLTYMDLI